MSTLLLPLLGLLLLHATIAGPLARTVLTPPILFAGAGALLAAFAPARAIGGEGRSLLLHVAELGLVLLLFTDGIRTDLGALRDLRALPSRLLSVGLLLTLLLGGVAALGCFPGLPLWEAGVLAAVLAPTDAGLGQVVVSDPRVPARVRQALNVEAGLNDGLAVPFLLFFLALASSAGGGEKASLLAFVLEQLGLGTLLGLVVGGFGGWLLRRAGARGWIVEPWGAIGLLVLPLACAVASPPLRASMFIAAFVGGLAARARAAPPPAHALELTEALGQLANLAVFYLFGLLFVGAWPRLEPVHALYAAASLTLVRMLPVALALWGAGLSRATVLFMGWFGPRGLASIVLALVYLEHDRPAGGAETVQLTVIATVAASILAHGLSARPGIAWLARVSGAPLEASGGSR